MKIGQVVRTLASGTALYLVMAACGASDRGGGGAVGGDGGGVDAEQIVDAFIDELGNPVKDANAGPLPPDVATEACDKMGGVGGSTASTFAVHQYPGKTAADLSAVQVLAHSVAGTAPTIDGALFDRINLTTIVRDGAVAINCGSQFDGATFILPR